MQLRRISNMGAVGVLNETASSSPVVRELRDDDGGRQASEAPDFSGEMCLIRVTAEGGQRRQWQTRTGAAAREESLEPKNARKRLRAVTEQFSAMPAKASFAHTEIDRKFADMRFFRHEATMKRVTQRTVTVIGSARCAQIADDRLLEQRERSAGRFRLEESRCQCLGASTPAVGQRDPRVGNLERLYTEPRRRRSGLESNAANPGTDRDALDERPGDWP